MPKLVHKLPSYRQHKSSGLAVVKRGGRDVSLGLHGTKTSRAGYDRVVAEWLAGGRCSSTSIPPSASSLAVGELILRYLIFAKGHYRRDGHPTRELDNIGDALRPV